MSSVSIHILIIPSSQDSSSHYALGGIFFNMYFLHSLSSKKYYTHVIIYSVVSTKASRQSTLGYTHGSSLSVDGAQTTNSMVTQDTDKLFIQVRPPSWRNTYVLRLIVLICVERI